jgi:hypothetical protein
MDEEKHGEGDAAESGGGGDLSPGGEDPDVPAEEVPSFESGREQTMALGRAGLWIFRVSAVLFLINIVGWLGVVFEKLPSYPFLPVAVILMVCYWTGRLMMRIGRRGS